MTASAKALLPNCDQPENHIIYVRQLPLSRHWTSFWSNPSYLSIAVTKITTCEGSSKLKALCKSGKHKQTIFHTERKQPSKQSNKNSSVFTVGHNIQGNVMNSAEFRHWTRDKWAWNFSLWDGGILLLKGFLLRESTYSSFSEIHGLGPGRGAVSPMHCWAGIEQHPPGKTRRIHLRGMLKLPAPW